MHIFPPPLIIEELEGFTPEKDIFDRAPLGKGLTNLVQNTKEPLVILLDSEWGTGKTTFLKMWAGELRNEGHPIVFFDAFANDYVDNAFLAICGEIISLAKEKSHLEKSKVDRFLDIAAGTGRVLLRNSAKIAVKGVTLGAVDAMELGREFESLGSDIAKVASEGADSYVRDALNRRESDQRTLNGFRKALADLATPPAGQVAQPNRPLVFILDELDRCRPSFSLDIIETIKHIFSVEGVHFLLAANINQLVSSVKYSYGNDIDAVLYLQKFYSLAVSFPDAVGRSSTIKRYIEYSCAYLYKDIPRDNKAEAIMEAVESVAEARALSFRTIDRVLATLKIAFAMTPADEFKLSPIIAGLCIMKVCDPHLFRRAKSGELTMPDVDSVFRFSQWSPRKSVVSERIRDWWRYLIEYKGEGSLPGNWDRFEEVIGANDFRHPNEVVPWTAQFVVDRIAPAR